MKELIISELPPYPNNPTLALRLYESVSSAANKNAEQFENLFHSNNWGSSWRNGVFSFHHYHSTAHEVLGCYSGTAQVQLGGPEGDIFRLNQGDAVLIPAGVAHCLISSSSDFHVVGAYPLGTYPDTCEGNDKLYQQHFEKIGMLDNPRLDPVSGQDF
jgi:uncharacterized protein YjlB